MADETAQPTKEVLEQIRPRLREHYINPPAPEAMLQITLELLLEGIETPSVLRCACMFPADNQDDIRDEFYEAMAELGMPKMSGWEAALEEIRYRAPVILEGSKEQSKAAINRIRGLLDFDDFAYGDRTLPELSLWFACWLDDSPAAKEEQQVDLEGSAADVVRKTKNLKAGS